MNLPPGMNGSVKEDKFSITAHIFIVVELFFIVTHDGTAFLVWKRTIFHEKQLLDFAKEGGSVDFRHRSQSLLHVIQFLPAGAVLLSIGGKEGAQHQEGKSYVSRNIHDV